MHRRRARHTCTSGGTTISKRQEENIDFQASNICITGPKDIHDDVYFYISKALLGHVTARQGGIQHEHPLRLQTDH